ncbi:hypothetical protein IAW_06087 [Bacillus cereus str. Schrouff]|nr:hypothetical protein IAW_06087 [Bacillus cereus str. Schrouff]EOO81586.1 hypothetical protein IGY_05812 [Bacillus cereus K-5975c]
MTRQAIVVIENHHYNPSLELSLKIAIYFGMKMKHFFGLLKSELLSFKEFDSMEHFEIELDNYIYYYNHKRIKTKLKGVSPVQYRVQSLLAA